MNYIYYLLMGLFWSGSFLGIKIAVSAFPPIYCALLRVMIAQALFFIIFKYFWHAPLKLSFACRWRAWVVGLFSIGIPFALLFWGEQSVAPALASIINGTVAIWSLIFSIMLFRDFSHATAPKIIGLLIGLTGVIIVFWPMINQSNSSKLYGLLAITGMALSYGIGATLNQRLLNTWRVNMQANLWHQFWASMIFLLAMALIFEPRPNFAIIYQNPKVLFALLYLGIGSTAIAWALFMKLIHDWGAVRTLSVMYLVPILAILWDYLFLDSIPSSNEIYGAIIILFGIALIQFSKRRAALIKPLT